MMSNKNNSFKLLFADISKQFKELNERSIWLLIATIGCWGIPNGMIQAIAMLLVFSLALYQIYPLERMIKKRIESLNHIKEAYGQNLTAGRLKFVKRKMRQFFIQQLWIAASCMVFVWISFFFIGLKLGIGLKIAYKSDKILEFLLSL